MKRKFLIIFLVIILLGTSQGIAVEDTTESTTETAIEEEIVLEPIEMDIEDTIEKTIENNEATIDQIDDQIDAAEDDVDAQEQLQEDMEEELKKPIELQSPAVRQDYVDALMIKKGYGVRVAQMQVTLLEKSKQQLIEGLELNAKVSYYKVLLAQKTVELNEEALNKANEQLKVVKVKFDNGSVTKLDLLQSELAVNQAKIEYDNAVDDLAIEQLAFNNTVGLPFEQEVILVGEIENNEIEEINLEEAISKAKEERMEAVEAREELEVAKIKLEAHDSYYNSNAKAYKDAKKEYENKQNNLENVYKDIELDVRQKYLELVKLDRSLNNINKTYELSLEAVRITSLFFEYGLSTTMDVLEAETALTQSEIGRYQLLVTYNLSKAVFDNACSIGTTPPSEDKMTKNMIYLKTNRRILGGSTDAIYDYIDYLPY